MLNYFRVLSFLLAITCVADASAQVSTKPDIGLNKVDLMQQYLGTASGGNGSAAYRRVTQAMARKAVDDAHDVGAAFVRVAISGTFPIQSGQRGDLDLWLRDPAAHWRLIDQMMDDLESRQLKIVPVFVWNTAQFPNIAGEKVDVFLREPDSKAWELLEQYVREFINRYNQRPALLFYEIGNELNLSADIDIETRCRKGQKVLVCWAAGNFSSDTMIEFTRRLALLIRTLDETHKISSGYAIPRPSAEHLRRRPERSTNKPDWTLDTIEDLQSYLTAVNQHVDIISVHLYPVKENQRFNGKPGEEYKLIQIIKQIADRIGKPLFVGEFGDMDARNSRPGGFSDQMFNQIVDLKIPYAAMWGLELYLKNPYTSYNSTATLSSLEPGSTDYLLGRFRQASALLKGGVQASSQPDTIPPHVVLTWPIECAKVTGNQTLYAVASDSGDSVERVAFLINGKVVATKVKPPYQLLWNAADKAPGEYTLSARAYDRAGNMAAYQTVVLVNTTQSTGTTCSSVGR
jgi:hypothetical protein